LRAQGGRSGEEEGSGGELEWSAHWREADPLRG
jgi:hypothetical protein